MGTGEWIGAISAFIAVLGIVAAIWVYRRQSQTKHLDYRITTMVPIMSDQATSLNEDLTIEYKGNRLTAPWLVMILIQNSGKQPVLATDYNQGIRIRFENNTPIQAKVNRESAQDIVKELYDPEDIEQILIRPDLLNPRDWFELQLLCDGEPGKVSVTSRLVGQNRPMRVIDESRRDRTNSRISFVALMAAAAVAFALVTFLLRDVGGWPFYLAFAVFSVTMLSGLKLAMVNEIRNMLGFFKDRRAGLI